MHKLTHNYSQARRCMTHMEKRLGKSERMEEFSKQFQGNVDKDVF